MASFRNRHNRLQYVCNLAFLFAKVAASKRYTAYNIDLFKMPVKRLGAPASGGLLVGKTHEARLLSLD
jgi:hypothetical protein